jgi:hypothetical protein
MTQADVLLDIDTQINTNGINYITGAVANQTLKNMFNNIYSAEIGISLLPTVTDSVIVATDDIRTIMARLQMQALTGDNGITAIGGVALGLGGDLSQNTVIGGGVYNLYLGDEGTNDGLGEFKTYSRSGFSIRNIDLSSNTISFTGSATSAGLVVSNVSGSQGWSVIDGQATLYVAGGSSSRFDIFRTGQTISGNGSGNFMQISDSLGSKGLVYAGDYSANFTFESLVSKRYVDSAIASFPSTLSDVLSNGNATGDQSIYSDDGNSVLDIKDTYTSMYYSNGTISSSVFANDGSSGVSYGDGVEYGTISVDDSQILMDHTVSLWLKASGTELYFDSAQASIYNPVGGVFVTDLMTLMSRYLHIMTTENVLKHNVKNTFNAPLNYFHNTLSLDNLNFTYDGNGTGLVSIDTGNDYGGIKNGSQYVMINSNSGYVEIFSDTNVKLEVSKDQGKILLTAPAVNFPSLTASRAVYLDINKNLVVSAVTDTELGYLSGATSNIQGQINNINTGLSWKAAMRVMTNSNITVSAPGSTIDGITMSAGDRVVLIGQSIGSENGPYTWNGAAVPMTRTTDCSTGGVGSTGVLGMTFIVEEGTYADQMWLLSTDAPITIGVTTLTYIKSGGTTYTASNGVTLTGNNFTLDNTYFGGDVTVAGGVVTIGANKVLYSMIAAMTSAQLAGIVSDETGTGFLVFSSAPTLTNPIVGTQSANDNSTKAASTAYADAKVAESITNGVTGIAPSQDVVFDALLTKADKTNGLESGGVITVGVFGANNVRVAAAQWYISPSSYSTAGNTDFSCALAAAGLQRYVGFYGDNANTITKVDGVESEYAAPPATPVGTALIGYILVTDAAAGSAPDLSVYLTRDPLILSITSSATPTLNTDDYDELYITAQATNLTSLTTNLTGSPGNGRILFVKIKDNGVARTIALGAKFTGKYATIPSTTIVGKELIMKFKYNSSTAIFELLAYNYSL